MTRKVRFRNVGAGKGVKEQLSEKLLRSLYLEQGLTQSEIARRYGCTAQFISILLHEHGITRGSSRGG